MSSETTPGPWHIGHHEAVNGYPIDTPEERIGWFNQSGNDTAIGEANARLIASAPELLDVLREVEQFICGDNLDLRDYHKKGMEGWRAQLWSAVRAAIAKAEGVAR